MDPSSAMEMNKAAQEEKEMNKKKARPGDENGQKCPRCESTNTKFCYYNNYSLTQPRYFCKSCRRYWTKGGTLRNVPVGGGCRRKNRRSSSSNKPNKSITTHQQQEQSFITNFPYESSSFINSFNLGMDDMMMCNPHNTLFDVLGNNFGATTQHGGFLETTSSTNGLMFHNNSGGLYFGTMGEMGIMPYEEEVHMSGGVSTSPPAAAAVVTAVKQEMCNDDNNGGDGEGDGGSRVLWGFPWQLGIGGEGNKNVVFGSNSWHGLLNSPLM